MGDVLLSMGNAPVALATYRLGLAIAEALVALDPSNTEWQRDLSVSYTKVGDALLKDSFDSSGALAAFRKSLAIRELLLKQDPANATRRRDLALNLERVGDMLSLDSDGPGALAAHGRAFAIREALATSFPANAELQRDLIVSCVKLGQVTKDRTHLSRALDIALDMQRRGVLAPRDAWMIDDLRRRLDQPTND